MTGTIRDTHGTRIACHDSVLTLSLESAAVRPAGMLPRVFCLRVQEIAGVVRKMSAKRVKRADEDCESASSEVRKARVRTLFSEAMGIRMPIMSAPMAGVSGGELAAAVARAGGLGFIAAGHARDLDFLDRQIQIFRSKTSDLP